MKRFEELYRIGESDDVLVKENAVHSDLDRRLDVVEQDAEAFRQGNRADVDAILKNLSSTFSGLAGQVQDLLDQAGDNLSADAIIESATRTFLTPERRALIVADADAHTNAVAAYILAILINGAPAGRDNLKALSDLIAAQATRLDAITGGADPLFDTFVEIAAKFGAEDAALGAVMDSLSKRIRVDAAMVLTDGEAARARLNLGKPAPLRVTANTVLDPQLGLEQEFDFAGAYTLTAPAVASVFAGWRSGVIHNRGNGSIATATYVGTIAVPTGAYLNGVLNGTMPVAYAQRGYLCWDASATPNPTWRFVYLQRSPLLLSQTYTNVGAFDFNIPPGYSQLDWTFSNFTPAVSGSSPIARVSADGGLTFRQGAADYLAMQLYNISGAMTAPAPSDLSALSLGGSQTSSAGVLAGLLQITMETKLCSCISRWMHINATPANVLGMSMARQQTPSTPVITPNYIRFLVSGGGAFSVVASCRGIPAQ